MIARKALNPQQFHAHVRRPIIPVAIALLVLLFGLPARADRIDDLSRQLRDRGEDYKVRLSAALNLGKLGNPRAIPALTDGLGDPDKSVRGVSAAALGKLVTASTPADIRNRAISALERAARSDSDNFVRSQAKKSFDAVKGFRGGGGGGGGGAPTGIDVYVEVGPMADNTKKAKAQLSAMRSTVEKTISRKAPAFLTRWPTGKSPSKGDLSKAGTKAAFFIDGSITGLNVKKQGSMAEVSCNVSLILASYPDKSMFGFLKGGAAVQTGASARDIDDAKQECVGAVVEDLVSRQVVPTIKQRLP